MGNKNQVLHVNEFTTKFLSTYNVRNHLYLVKCNLRQLSLNMRRPWNGEPII